MSDSSPFGFGRFVPGFDFLQNLAKGSAAGVPPMPGLSNWVAPTVSVEELDKRIEELKAVQFWLEQNARALTATIQALEVQKMTLATLKGMNVAMGDLAGAFAAQAPGAAPAPAPEQPKDAEPPAPPQAAAAGVVDPMQWWNALSTQFQQIAAGALQEATRGAAPPQPAAAQTPAAPAKKKAAAGKRPRPAAKKSAAPRAPRAGR